MMEREGLQFVQRLCKGVSGAAAGIVRLHGGQGPLIEAKCHWCGNAGGPSGGQSSLMSDWKKHRRAPLEAAVRFPVPRNPMEENGCAPFLIWEFGLLTQFSQRI